MTSAAQPAVFKAIWRVFQIAALAWGPVHGSSSEQVEVQMIYGLASVGAGVDYDSVAFVEVLLVGELAGDAVEMAHESFFLLAVPYLSE